MKKLLLITTGMLMLFTVTVKAQIILEHTYDYHHKVFWVTDLGNNDYKYVMEDSTGFTLYNLDHSLFLNVTVPLPLFQLPNSYEVAYITKSLFDCDSANIEYVVSTANYSTNFYVYRTDGTLLFERDSVQGPYCVGCALGSINTQPIFNTPDGAKLLLFTKRNYGDYDPDSISIYSLCGTAPTFIREVTTNGNYVKIYPNPTSGMINFEIMPPNNQERFKLTIYSSNFEVVDANDIIGRRYQLDLSSRSLSSGTYFFDLRTGNKIFQTGKFIISP